MREIKFRAWDETQNHWVNSAHIELRIDGVIYDPISQRFPSDYQLMQYTGLKDKNGKEIYEGDIVRTLDGYPATVSWDEKHTGYDPFGSGEGAEWGDGVEVIGNIYEDPKLTVPNPNHKGGNNDE